MKRLPEYCRPVVGLMTYKIRQGKPRDIVIAEMQTDRVHGGFPDAVYGRCYDVAMLNVRATELVAADRRYNYGIDVDKECDCVPYERDYSKCRTIEDCFRESEGY